MDVKECLEKGLLKKIQPSIEKAKRSIEISKSKLEKAKELLKLKILDMAEVSAYSSMFHAARALLFRDGLKERSHYAVFVYLKEHYSDKIELRFLNELNALRLERHEIFYGFEEPDFSDDDIGKTIKTAEEFIALINKILEMDKTAKMENKQKKTKCPLCSSTETQTVEEEGEAYLVCKICGYDQRFEYDEIYSDEKSSPKGKGSFSPYKRGGARRTQK